MYEPKLTKGQRRRAQDSLWRKQMGTRPEIDPTILEQFGRNIHPLQRNNCERAPSHVVTFDEDGYTFNVDLIKGLSRIGVEGHKREASDRASQILSNMKYRRLFSQRGAARKIVEMEKAVGNTDWSVRTVQRIIKASRG